MKKAIYKLILFIAITAFVLSLSPTVTAEPNDTDTTQIQSVAPETKPIYKAHNPEPAPHKQSATNNENSQLQLAKEQLRGDFYKDSQDNLKWAIKIIVGLATAFVGFAFASMGVILFKNKKDYEHALADAKEAARDAKDAAKNARDLEKEAQDILTDIKEQAKTTIDEIKKKGNEERQKSSKEAGRQRKISELSNKGYKAIEAKDYEIATECYRQIVEDPKEKNNPDVYNNWGVALLRFAGNKKGEEAEKLLNQAIEKYRRVIDIKQDHYEAYQGWGNVLSWLAINKKGEEREELFNQSIEKYKKAAKIKQNDPKVYSSWGGALTELARNKKGTEAEELLNQAFEKYKKATDIKQDYYDAYSNWGAALLDMAKLKGGEDAKDLLNQAEEKCLKAESIKTGENAYNLACVYAMRGNEDKCKEWLKVGEKAETLPSREDAMADDDLKSVRDKEWFKSLRWKGE